MWKIGNEKKQKAVEIHKGLHKKTREEVMQGMYKI